MRDRLHPAWILVAVGVVFLIAYSIALEALRKPHGRIVTGDAAHYYVYLRSAVFDRDLSFENDYLTLYGLERGDPATRGIYRTTTTGYASNVWSIGPAIVWAPLFLLVTAAVWLANLAGAGIPLDGFGRIFQASAGWAGIVAATAGAVIAFRLCRELFEESLSLGATLTIWLGSSTLYYSMVSPTYSHAASMLVTSAFFCFWATTIDRRDAARFAALGALGGLCALVRWQDAVFLIVPAVDLLTVLARSPRDPRAWRHAFLGGIVCLGAAVLVFTPQMAAWTALYGTPFTIPQGGNWMQWTSPALGAVLFSDNHGLISWTPVVLPALIGLVLLIRDRPAIAPGLLAALLVSLYGSAAALDWWAGASFGARRFVSCFPIFVLGLAAVGARLRPSVRRAGAAFLVVANALLLFQYQLYMHGLRDIAPHASGFYGLYLARFAVPFELLRRWLSEGS